MAHPSHRPCTINNIRYSASKIFYFDFKNHQLALNYLLTHFNNSVELLLIKRTSFTRLIQLNENRIRNPTSVWKEYLEVWKSRPWRLSRLKFHPHVWYCIFLSGALLNSYLTCWTWPDRRPGIQFVFGTQINSLASLYSFAIAKSNNNGYFNAATTFN